MTPVQSFAPMKMKYFFGKLWYIVYNMNKMSDLSVLNHGLIYNL